MGRMTLSKLTGFRGLNRFNRFRRLRRLNRFNRFNRFQRTTRAVGGSRGIGSNGANCYGNGLSALSSGAIALLENGGAVGDHVGEDEEARLRGIRSGRPGGGDLVQDLLVACGAERGLVDEEKPSGELVAEFAAVELELDSVARVPVLEVAQDGPS